MNYRSIGPSSGLGAMGARAIRPGRCSAALCPEFAIVSHWSKLPLEVMPTNVSMLKLLPMCKEVLPIPKLDCAQSCQSSGKPCPNGLRKCRVLIIAEEPAMTGLSIMASGVCGLTVLQATRTRQVLETATAFVPHLVLLEWTPADATCRALLSLLRSDHPQLKRPPVMLISDCHSEDDIVAGLELGADDYIAQPYSPSELLARVRTQLRGIAGEVAKAPLHGGRVTLDLESCTVSIGAQRVPVESSAFKLLRFLLAHPGQVFSRRQLLEKVCEGQSELRERAVDVHVSRLRRALKNEKGLIRTIHGKGYCLSSG